MTTETTATSNQNRPALPPPQTASIALDQRMLAAFVDAPFAQLLNGAATPAGERERDRPADEPAPAKARARETDDAGEGQAAAPHERTGAQAAAAAGAPVTIHALNDKLLRGEGTLARATQEASVAAPKGEGARERRADGGAPAASAEGEPKNVKSESIAAGEGAKPAPAAPPSPLAALTRAGEMAQSAVPKRERAPTAPTEASRGVQGVAGTASVTTVRVIPAGRDARPAVTGLTPVNAAQSGAQRTRGDVRGVRVPQTPGAGPSQQARAEAFQAQLARGLAAAVEKGQGTLTMRLKPEALGQLHVKVSMKDGVLSASFQAETAQARDLLMSTTGELRRSLEAAGLNVERIEASVSPQLREIPNAEGATSFDAGQYQGETPGGDGGDGAPDRNDSDPQEGKRGTDAARIPEVDDAAEPRAGGAGWVVMGVDVVV